MCVLAVSIDREMYVRLTDVDVNCVCVFSISIDRANRNVCACFFFFFFLVCTDRANRLTNLRQFCNRIKKHERFLVER